MLRPEEQVEFDGKLVYPVGGHEDIRAHFREWLRFFRGAALRNVLREPYGPAGLDGELITEEQARMPVKSPTSKESITLLGGLNHLRVMEYTWFAYIVEKERALSDAEIYGDEFIPVGLTLVDAVRRYREQGRASDLVIMRHDLSEVFTTNIYAADGSTQSLTFLQILLHVYGELARHTGQFDVVSQHSTGYEGE